LTEAAKKSEKFDVMFLQKVFVFLNAITFRSSAAPLTWNSLPPAVLNCDSLSTFKSRHKTHLFSTAFC